MAEALGGGLHRLAVLGRLPDLLLDRDGRVQQVHVPELEAEELAGAEPCRSAQRELSEAPEGREGVEDGGGGGGSDVDQFRVGV
ncbi:hypothetical protein ACGFYY_02510 [Streptomyces sp. NPDC048331]|uniref:hypothetical protein n=1 Tax=Streptomyces sp. NPDC048331 TaxID=3365534 RepID=UPI0037201E3E